MSARPALLGRWAILGLLVLTTAVNLMDRQLPFIMAEPIRTEFALSDTQLGMLGGIAFSLVYAIGALPLARIADRHPRKWVLAACLATWSLFTAFGGAAQSFVQLMVTRAGVAIGEAGAAPSSHSLISDLFSDGRRALALALNTAGIAIGVLLGMAIGGLLLEHLPWRTVLLFAAVPGLILALVFALAVREPPRVGAQAHPVPPPVSVALATLWRQRAFVWLTIAATLGAFATSGGAAFGPAFFMRAHHLSIGEAGVLFGLLLGCGAAIGGIASGLLADRLMPRDPRWLLWIPAIGFLVKTPLYCASWMVDGFALAIALQFAAWLAGGSYLPLSYTATQAIASPRMRAFSSAMIQLVLNLLGNVLGPLAVGALSDRLNPVAGTAALGFALAICGVGGLLSALAFFRAARFFPQDVARRTAEVAHAG